MSSGRQTAFAFGEVSPALRFMSDSTFYSKALSKLENGTVRKSGGAQNRAGTKLFLKPTYQDSIPFSGSNVGVRLFPFTSTEGIEYIIEVQDRVEASPIGWDFIANPFFLPTSPVRIIYPDGSSYLAFQQAYLYHGITDTLMLDLDSASITILSDSAVISFNDGNIIVINHLTSEVDPLLRFILGSQLSEPQRIGTPAAMSSITYNGQAPTDIPVCYLVTQELTDGSEVVWQEGCALVGHPHSQLSSVFDIDAVAGFGIKQYNIYRSAGTGTAGNNLRGSSYALVGRVNPQGSGTKFRDFLTVPDITVQPPIQKDLYPVTFFPTVTTASMAGIRRLIYYKGRTIIIYVKYRLTSATPYQFSEGQLGASKIGAPLLFGRPLTPNSVDAFTFTIPTDKLSRITNILVMNRLIVFTNNHTFSIRGGISGVLTPQEVNPEVIYHEGCTPHVTPVGVGNRGYFISNDRSKLLMIMFQRDDSVTVSDISVLSDHLFEAKDIRTMAVSNSAENTLWMLKKDGTLLSLTISEEGGVLGYARHNTDGFIEDISIQETKLAVYPDDVETQTSPTLLLSVIREGVRYYEKMAVRNDINIKRFLYADSAIVFGTTQETRPLNIFHITDYLAGSTFLVQNTDGSDFFDATWEGKQIDFFFQAYDSTNNKYFTSKVRIILDTFIDLFTMEAHCEEDIPEVLQDIDSQALTPDEKEVRKKQWLTTINQVTGLAHLALKQVSVFADGSIISSPLNPEYESLTVDINGVLDLPNYVNWGYIGLPYATSIETLNLEASDSRTFTDTGKLINVIGIGVTKTIGGFVGQTGVTDLLDMEEFKTRREENIEEATGTYSGYLEFMYPSTWESTGRVLLKQVDPAPMSILSVYPKGVKGD